jgi:hypothetical protein
MDDRSMYNQFIFDFSYFFKGIQAVRIEFFFILKVANIRCFILIAVEIVVTVSFC